MRKLSLWAKYNPHFARTIIVVSHFLLICIAVKLGILSSSGGVQLSVWWVYFFITFFFVIALLYPTIKKTKKTKWNYIKQKSCDFLAALCSFCLVCCFVNQLNNNSFSHTANAYIGTHTSTYKNAAAEKLLTDLKNGEKRFFSRKEKRIIKDEFKYQVKQYAKAKLTGNKKGGSDALLIILSCIAALGLITLVGGLACSLSCNGSEAASVIVLVLGTVGIIWGLIAVIKSIKKKHKTISGHV